MENVAPIIAPNKDQMLAHLDMLFGRALSGRVEITGIHTDKDGKRPQTEFFDVDALDEAADFAVKINAQPGWNLYVGAALRIESVFPGKAATDDDFLKTYMVWADADDGDQLAHARETYLALGMTPPLAVVTGRTPSKRAQLWWPLDNPIDNIDTLRATLRGIAAVLKTDPKVCTGKQLMRLAGGVNWPKKEDRILERTETVVVAKAAREFSIEQIHRAFSPMARAEFSSVIPDVEIAHAGALGLEERVMDGRETYAFNLVTAHLHEFLGTNGCEPTVDELYRSVAPVFLAKSDQIRPGRGPEFLKQKCADRLRAYHAGQIPFMRGLEEAAQSWAEREQRSDNVRAYRGADGYAAAEEGGEDADPEPAGAIQATPYTWIDAAKIPPRDVLYGRHVFRKFLSATVAPGGLGKSSLVIVDALACVVGRDLIGDRPQRPLKVWLWNGEDPLEELQRRIAAACLHYQIGPDDLAGRLFVDSGRDTEIVVVREDRDGFKIAEPVVSALVEQVRSKGIDVLVIDPFVACHAVNENDNTKIEAVVKQWMRVAEEGGCGIELVHHVRKPSGGASETTVDDARGAGALLAKVRSARVLNAMTTAEAADIGIEVKDRFSFFRVDNGKANLMPRGGDAQWRRMVGVPLGNRVDTQEDNVGVATAWEKPGVFDGFKEQHLHQVRAAVAGGEWRYDVQCSNWVGHAIAGALGLDSDSPADRSRIKSMLKVWIKNSELEVVDGLDQARKMKRFVIVGRGQE